jgi:DNA-3-methyladenine glycosylase
MRGAATQDQTAKKLPAGAVLPAAFFARPSDEVAADLVGKVLWRLGVGGGRVSEVEAYLSAEDPASHAARGRTARNSPMFGPPGCLYVFLSYGVHCLLNIVCDRVGLGSAVLIRSYQPADEGGPRGGEGGARGPGLVGRSLGIGLELSGLPLGGQSGVFVVDDGVRPEVGRARRVGISQGADLALRHYIVGSRYVSGPAWMIGGRGR